MTPYFAQMDRKGHNGIGKAKKKQQWRQKGWKKRSPKEAITWLHTDHLNTPRTATNNNGETVWRWHGKAS